MECPQCVYANPDGVKFCINCGETFAKDNSQVDENSFFYEFAHYVDMVPKMERSIEPKFQNVFSRVFRDHSELEAERLFIVGTALTTPKITEVTDTWPKPWLFARVFVIALLAFAGFYIGVDYFRNINFIPGLLMIGASAVPLTTLIFFWEMNAPQNIAFYRVIFVGFIGGILSMLVALVFFDIVKNNINPITIGITEELAKAIMVISFVRYRKYRYILNGLLIGAAVGAGFAAFETAGYALRSLMSGDAQNLYTTILWRGLLAPGGHVAWAALTGAAFCRVQGDQPFRLNMLVKIKFLRVFLLVVVMHALWDTPINGMFPFGQIFLTLASWVVVFLLIRAGLKEIGEKKLLV
ncbi:PrsW family intramembrane metalloprotease [Neobacillus sp. MM2021_6]|uniref:PrsW family intramembrane metalloprotease n=1 Tax=Bacillaceae TaxID=186817 RepID=UPI00140DDC83|nr:MULTISPECIES: PrsW family intramembrane metalloprotease [Bacillaceae]MBO0959859.1 PrsW family intramembrane metalloprotease [Neobacillus sp. MM2021_6]NHC20493.1 PrsW family intramembrane metalloprotease [Bacillus sp. MM2020_4]